MPFTAPLHFPETNRLQALYDYEILDSAPEESYNDLLHLAHSIFKSSIVAINFLDEDCIWIKASVGLHRTQTERAASFCNSTIQSDEVLEISDAQLSPLFRDLPFVREGIIRFYAGTPLITPQGYRIGTLCLADHHPRTLTEAEQSILQNLARQVMTKLELDLKKRELQANQNTTQAIARKLDIYKLELDQITYALSHELKSPLRAINNLAEWVEEELHGTPSQEIKRNLTLMRGRVQRLENLYNGLLTYTKTSTVGTSAEQVDLQEMLDALKARFQQKHRVQIDLPYDLPVVITQKRSLEMVFHQLVQNAIWHNLGIDVRVQIGWRFDSSNQLIFFVKDNGIGIHPSFQEKVFGMFKTIAPWDQQENTGLGLALVKKILTERDAHIWLVSEENEGCTFTFTWPL